MAAKRREVDPADIERWAAIRTAVYERLKQLRGGAIHLDALDAIAYLSVLPEMQPFDDALRRLINQARDEKATWREIATAMGEKSETRVQTKQDWRNRRASD